MNRYDILRGKRPKRKKPKKAEIVIPESPSDSGDSMAFTGTHTGRPPDIALLSRDVLETLREQSIMGFDPASQDRNDSMVLAYGGMKVVASDHLKPGQMVFLDRNGLVTGVDNGMPVGSVLEDGPIQDNAGAETSEKEKGLRSSGKET